MYLSISWRITLNSILNCGCCFGSVYFHGRVEWLVFVTTIMDTCSVKEGGLFGYLKDYWTPKKDHAMQFHIQ